MAFEVNTEYDRIFVEAQTNYVTTDPFGNTFTIWQGQQFKWYGREKVTTGCGSCGTKKELYSYLIDAYAHCCEGEYLWPAESGKGKGIYVTSDVFIETENLKYPPIINDFITEQGGTDVDLFTPPWKRKVPREGGLWYKDPWNPNA